MLDASIIICTYSSNRWNDLIAAIESAEQQLPPARQIVVVVDHNPYLLEQVRNRYPHITVVENRYRQGLSGARTSGITAAVGARIAFLDDDAVAEQDWLELLCAWCDEPNVVGAGGRVVPAWSGDLPRWFPEEFYWVLGCSYRGMPTTSAAVRNVFGGCMCVRREVFDHFGGFHNHMGRVSDTPLGCEETELCIRVNQGWPDAKFIYEPKALIHHHIAVERVDNWKYFRSRCYGEGLSKARLSRLVGSNDALASERAYTFSTLPRGVFRGLRESVVHHDSYGIVRSAAIIVGLLSTAVGYIRGFRELGGSSHVSKATADRDPENIL